MADNFTVNGVPVAADDVAGVYYQRIKLIDGTADSPTGIPGDATNGLDVDVTRSALPALAATSTKQSDGTHKTQIVDGSGNVIGATTNALDVHIKSGAGSGGTAVTDEATFTLGSTSITPVGGVYKATPDTVVDGKAAAAAIDVNRAWHVRITGDDVGEAAVAHDAVDTGNPLKIGGQARSTDPTAVANADRTNATFTLLGKQIVYPWANPALSWVLAASAGGLVNTTGVTARGAAGSGNRNYVRSIQVINSHATISTEVVIRDGAAGSVMHRGWAQAAGGGYAVTFDPPLRGSANTLVEVAEVTATASTGVLVNVQGFQAAE